MKNLLASEPYFMECFSDIAVKLRRDTGREVKIIDLDDFIALMHQDREQVVISVPNYPWMARWDDSMLEELCSAPPLFEFPYFGTDGNEPIGYFAVPETVSSERLERLCWYQNTLFFVCAPAEEFFAGLPLLVHNIIATADVWRDEVLAALATMEGYRWIVMQEGDQGDTYYWLIESQSPD
ncbi:hypothetical protein SAMN02745857_02218 [Andreprevotia lacus DSM 23236]|uniref:Uncharacterized protein n=1 Tax=Andreprevotia lacus DSM 23236 TaxID=1121001 RepID=A0A1W1XNN1_9NEIS|nr:hypothetical protein [Andreprevotia lacus]SMC25573.1 hypothetical protein SAMN02745857_02218 [Andreprevotia lacus DSM 23236]